MSRPKNLESMRFHTLTNITTAASKLRTRFENVQDIAQRRKLKLPEHLRIEEGAFPFLQPACIDGKIELRRMKLIRTSSLQPDYPLASGTRPSGLSIFMNYRAVVLVDPLQGNGPRIQIGEANRTLLISKFTNDDLTDTLKTIERLSTQLRDFEIQYGGPRLLRKVLDALSAS